ncbi:MAG: hypothetical protein AAGH65_09685, partial [Pseudomonadota bacterium]
MNLHNNDALSARQQQRVEQLDFSNQQWRSISAALCVFGLMVSSYAVAQSEQGTSASVDQDDVVELTRVVVTARRIEEDESTVPLTIRVIDDD